MGDVLQILPGRAVETDFNSLIVLYGFWMFLGFSLTEVYSESF